jgi:dipeptidyl aminopeptidase/acylaminoacyl peptidase
VNRPRLFAGFLASCIAAWHLLCFAIGVVATEGALHPARSTLTRSDESRAQAVAGEFHATVDEVEIAGADGAMLRGWSIQPPADNGDAVILLHGQSDNRAGMLGNAELLLRHGFAVLLPDARAHGESGGSIATYGVKEAGDIRSWFEWLKHAQSPRCIDGIGDSMGAAQLLESLAAEREFCAVVAESSFATFQEAAYDRLGQWFQTGPWLGRTLLRPAIEGGFLYANLRYGVDLTQANPLKSVAASPVPVLLIHGLADTNLPPSHSERIVASNREITLWEVPGAGHCGAEGAQPEEYERRVVGWLVNHRRMESIEVPKFALIVH